MWERRCNAIIPRERWREGGESRGQNQQDHRTPAAIAEVPAARARCRRQCPAESSSECHPHQTLRLSRLLRVTDCDCTAARTVQAGWRIAPGNGLSAGSSQCRAELCSAYIGVWRLASGVWRLAFDDGCMPTRVFATCGITRMQTGLRCESAVAVWHILTGPHAKQVGDLSSCRAVAGGATRESKGADVARASSRHVPLLLRTVRYRGPRGARRKRCSGRAERIHPAAAAHAGSVGRSVGRSVEPANTTCALNAATSAG